MSNNKLHTINSESQDPVLEPLSMNYIRKFMTYSYKIEDGDEQTINLWEEDGQSFNAIELSTQLVDGRSYTKRNCNTDEIHTKYP